MHGRRTLNGKSTWVPPVTDLAHQALRQLTDPSATRILQILGAKYLLVHNGDMPPYRRRRMRRLLRDRENFRHVHASRGDDVYQILRPNDSSLGTIFDQHQAPWQAP